MDVKILELERTFHINHAYAMSFFDKRGKIVKDLKNFLPYVDVSTNKDEKVMLSSELSLEEGTIQGFFTPEKFSMRYIGNENLEEFYQMSYDFSLLIESSLGLADYLDSIFITVSFEVEFEHPFDAINYFKERGIYLTIPENYRLLSNDIDTLIVNTDTDEAFSLKIEAIQSESENVRYEIGVMGVYTAPDSFDEASSEDFKVFFNKLHNELETMNFNIER